MKEVFKEKEKVERAQLKREKSEDILGVQTWVKVGQYGPVLCATKRFSVDTQHWRSIGEQLPAKTHIQNQSW